MENLNRRKMLKKSVAITASASLFGLSSFWQGKNADHTVSKKLKVVVIGAHPDDPETMCGGTMILYSQNGHDVVSAYLTRGEGGIEGVGEDEAAKIRSAECIEACKILKAKPVFLNHIDGHTEINLQRYTEMIQFITSEKPDLVITHWPVDTHRDHRICSNLVYDAWIQLNKSFDLYYGEVMTGGQTQIFTPTLYIDISSVIETKHTACYCHKSQEIEKEYPLFHAKMEIFRGMEAGCKFAEAFIQQNSANNSLKKYINE